MKVVFDDKPWDHRSYGNLTLKVQHLEIVFWQKSSKFYQKRQVGTQLIYIQIAPDVKFKQICQLQFRVIITYYWCSYKKLNKEYQNF